MIKRTGEQSLENSQSSIQKLGSDIKCIRREYNNNPIGFIQQIIGVPDINPRGN
jgi:hypothetical protein